MNICIDCGFWFSFNACYTCGKPLCGMCVAPPAPFLIQMSSRGLCRACREKSRQPVHTTMTHQSVEGEEDVDGMRTLLAACYRVIEQGQPEHDILPKIAKVLEQAKGERHASS